MPRTTSYHSCSNFITLSARHPCWRTPEDACSKSEHPRQNITPVSVFSFPLSVLYTKKQLQVGVLTDFRQLSRRKTLTIFIVSRSEPRPLRLHTRVLFHGSSARPSPGNGQTSMPSVNSVHQSAQLLWSGALLCPRMACKCTVPLLSTTNERAHSSFSSPSFSTQPYPAKTISLIGRWAFLDSLRYYFTNRRAWLLQMPLYVEKHATFRQLITSFSLILHKRVPTS